MNSNRLARSLAVAALLFPLAAWAQSGGLPALTSTPAPGGSQTYTLSIQTLLTITALTFIPAALLMMTSFTRIIIVLAILRQALGLQQSPPNRVLIGISLVLTLLIMRPVWSDIYEHAFKPFDAEEISLTVALERAEQPLRTFMLAQTRETDLEQMLRIGGESLSMKPAEVPFTILMPAFVLSELNTAFQIGFMLFVPFLVIDLVVASVLMAMGMMMLSPLIISLPFKLMVFVLVDGWAMTVGTLAASFAGG